MVGTLEKGKSVDLTSEEPGFYGVIAEGKKGYVKSCELATAIDELPAAKDAEFAARAKTASDAMDAAGHAAGKALRGAGTAPRRAAARCPTGSASSSTSSRWSPPGPRRRTTRSRSSTTT